jgi:hypothetical protein
MRPFYRILQNEVASGVNLNILNIDASAAYWNIQESLNGLTLSKVGGIEVWILTRGCVEKVRFPLCLVRISILFKYRPPLIDLSSKIIIKQH